MVSLDYESNRTWDEAQAAFVQSALRASFELVKFEIQATKFFVDVQSAVTVEELRASLKKCLFIAKSINKDLIFHNDSPIHYNEDPQPALERKRDVIPVHPGFFTFQGDFLKVFHAINRKIYAIAGEYDAIEQEYPAIWPVKLFKAIDYFHDFPHQVILCAPVKDDFSARTEFATKYAKSQDFESIEMSGLIANSEYGLEPAVCDCCYYGLQGNQCLNNGFYTCYNKVFRNERSNSERLDRLTNFSVRDVMFVGTEAFVLESRQRLIESLSLFISKLNLNAKIETANDPFFANDSVMKSVFQNSHRLKYELLARIPHLEREIAIGSINFHMDFFGKAFGIATSSGGIAHSGCIGVGMERTTYALFCQNGPDVSQWPIETLSYLGLSQRI